MRQVPSRVKLWVGALLVLEIIVFVGVLWWGTLPQTPATEASAASQLLSRIRIAPDEPLPRTVAEAASWDRRRELQEERERGQR